MLRVVDEARQCLPREITQLTVVVLVPCLCKEVIENHIQHDPGIPSKRRLEPVRGRPDNRVAIGVCINGAVQPNTVGYADGVLVAENAFDKVAEE